MKEGVNKKGLSPVVASALLILLILILAAIIFFWASGFFAEQIEKFDKPIQESCSSINFEVARVGTDFENSRLEVKNGGDIDIRHLEIRLTKGGNTEARMFDFSVDANKIVTEPVSFAMDDGGVPEKAVVYPALIGKVVGKAKNSAYTCLDSGVVLTL